MRRAIRTHRTDVIAVVVMVALALATAGYILLHQPAFTLLKSPYVVRAAFADAAAVGAGQGEAVTIAGVPVGSVGAVRLEDGRAIVTLDLDRRYAPVYRDATVLTRERTPLKDMYLSLEPGTPGAGRVPDGGLLGAGATTPTVDVDQVLRSLDADTRTYLLLALSGGRTAFADGGDRRLAALFRRFPPLLDTTASFTRLLARRTADLRGAIGALGQVAGALGGVDTQLTRLVEASDRDFGALASQDRALRTALDVAPGTLGATARALAATRAFTDTASPALRALVPFAQRLGPALGALDGLAAGTRSAIAGTLSPFTVAVRPLATALAPAAARLTAAAPELTRSLGVVNGLLNGLAHHAAGGGSFLLDGAWLAHDLNSALSLQDADGAVVRSLFLASCPALGLIETQLPQTLPSLGALLPFLHAPTATAVPSSFCPRAVG